MFAAVLKKCNKAVQRTPSHLFNCLGSCNMDQTIVQNINIDVANYGSCIVNNFCTGEGSTCTVEQNQFEVNGNVVNSNNCNTNTNTNNANTETLEVFLAGKI